MNVTRPKCIQIDLEFFFELISYAYLHEDPEDPSFIKIDAAFHKKLDAMERHNLYTTYKTGVTEEDRRKAREDYLQLAGILESCRWADRQDINVTHNILADLIP